MSLTVHQNANPPWGILATVAWLLSAFFISLLVAAMVYGVWKGANPVPRTATYDGLVIGLGTLASVPVQIAVLSLAAQLRQWRPADYFALTKPRRAEVIFALTAVLVVNFAFDALLYVTGRDIVPVFQSEAYQSAKEFGWLAGLTIAIVIVAPIGEEIAFRGFLYRGLARPGREMIAIGIISFVWALLHIQYDWLGMLQIFTVGLMLGWFRWASGSTTLAILMHCLVNVQAMIETALKVELLS
jgi:membrane protease YdiL (CAAX protease family)